MFARSIEKRLKKGISAFPVTVLTGPRQSGKTTLLKYLLPNFHYVTLESPDNLLLIKSDPRGFLLSHLKGLIIDEAQNYPDIFSYIQEIVDEYKSARIVLSGSQNFLLAEKISQTLAGRAVIFELLPLSYQEFCTNKSLNEEPNLWEYLYNGSYPRPYQEKLPVNLWYDSYIRTYLERDVRSLTAVNDLSKFQLFLKFCAGFHGQEFNASSIANNLGLSQTTITNWLSILEASYIVYRLKPYYKNYKKRLVKRPKLYFYDSAIVCKLLNIESSEHLKIHASRGAIFEGFVITELMKYQFAEGSPGNNYFWREHSGTEVDLIIESGNTLKAFEIKSGMTILDEFTKGLTRLTKIITDQNIEPNIVYAGDLETHLGQIPIISWRNLKDLFIVG
jgi:predicted AAA+ superfamily ATPase